MSLCWKCKEVWKEQFQQYFTEERRVQPWLHCHHDEPEEKPKEKCWCGKNQTYTIMDGAGGYFIANFCPICGKKLNV